MRCHVLAQTLLLRRGAPSAAGCWALGTTAPPTCALRWMAAASRSPSRHWTSTTLVRARGLRVLLLLPLLQLWRAKLCVAACGVACCALPPAAPTRCWARPPAAPEFDRGLATQEITILASVCDHPNIVTLHDVWEDGNHIFLVMEVRQSSGELCVWVVQNCQPQEPLESTTRACGVACNLGLRNAPRTDVCGL